MRLGKAWRGGVLGLAVATAEVFDEYLFEGLVVGDQDVARGMAAAVRLNRRKSEEESGAASYFAFGADRAGMGEHDVLGDGES
jgi:hypothetical protein